MSPRFAFSLILTIGCASVTATDDNSGKNTGEDCAIDCEGAGRDADSGAATDGGASADDGSTVDHDGDGYTGATDCDDASSRVHPGRDEVTCNDVDDDCNASTDDDPDADLDSFGACVDCDDADRNVHPDAADSCDDAIDNDCDGHVDEGCSIDYTGVWTLESAITYDCGMGVVGIAFSELDIADHYPDVIVTIPATLITTGVNTGAFSTASTFTAHEYDAYSIGVGTVINGTFTSDNALEGTIDVHADVLNEMGLGVSDCVNTTFRFRATR